jgi:hypothetical protein
MHKNFARLATVMGYSLVPLVPLVPLVAADVKKAVA